jgi:hypothetical protein
VRVYVIFGQGGRITSLGMVSLADRIAALGIETSTHSWGYPGIVVQSIQQLKSMEPVAIIGYSLGANATTWISNKLSRVVDLIVAYDPSVWSNIEPAGRNVKRLLLYHNSGINFFGKARIPGPQVETTEISMSHILVDYSEPLHQKTLEAIRIVHKKE